MILFWYASGGPASETAARGANGTRTSIAMTMSYLMQPRTKTPAPASTSTLASLPSPTNTSLLPQPNTPISPIAPELTAIPTQTTAPIPIFTFTAPPRQGNTKAPRLPFQSATPIVIFATPTVIAGTPSLIQDPADFARWYFTRVWNERDYQNLWENYLTASYKANVGSGLFEDYVWWWDSVQRVDINAVDVLQNNGSDAWVRVNLTFHMQDGRVVRNQVYDYDFLYDPSRGTWMFDSS